MKSFHVGERVILDPYDPNEFDYEEFEHIEWRLNNNTLALWEKPSPGVRYYRNSMVLNPKNAVLTIKKTEEFHSGVYTVIANREKEVLVSELVLIGKQLLIIFVATFHSGHGR